MKEQMKKQSDIECAKCSLEDLEKAITKMVADFEGTYLGIEVSNVMFSRINGKIYSDINATI